MFSSFYLTLQDRQWKQQYSKFIPSEIITVSEPFVDYSSNLREVDHLVQIRSYDSVGGTEKKWWKYMFWGMFNIPSIDPYKICRQ